MREGSTGDSPGLRGRRGVVTGGAAGIGAAVASRLTVEGSQVLIADVDEWCAGPLGHAHVRQVAPPRRRVGQAGADAVDADPAARQAT